MLSAFPLISMHGAVATSSGLLAPPLLFSLSLLPPYNCGAAYLTGDCFQVCFLYSAWLYSCPETVCTVAFLPALMAFTVLASCHTNYKIHLNPQTTLSFLKPAASARPRF